MILQDKSPITFDKLLQPGPFGRTKILNIEFSRIVSRFLMDRERAKSFWVNSQKYGDLARCILEFMCDK